MDPHGCPIYTSNQRTIRRMLDQLSLQSLINQADNAFYKISPVDRMTYNINNYVQSYGDREGYTKYILDLVKANKIGFLHIPYFYDLHPEYEEALGRRNRNFSFLFPKDEEKAQGTDDLMDDLMVASGDVEISNPRWEHVDPDKKENSPDEACVGDKISLLADVKNRPEGSEVIFDIYDMSGDSPLRIDTAKGKLENGVGKGEWIISDPNEQNDKLKLSFEAIAKSKATEKCEIEVVMEYTLSY